MLEHFLARRLLLGQRRFRQLDQFRAFAFAEAPGPLADQIDEADDLVAFADRQLPQQQRPFRDQLQRLEGFPETGLAGFHLVDEDHMGNAVLVEEFEDRCHHHGARRFRLHHHQGDVGDHQRVVGFLLELDGSRTVEKGPAVSQIGRCGDTDLGAHAALAGFLRGVADAIAFGHAALAVDGLAGQQQRFEERRLAAGEWADQGGDPRLGGSGRHNPLLIISFMVLILAAAGNNNNQG